MKIENIFAQRIEFTSYRIYVIESIAYFLTEVL